MVRVLLFASLKDIVGRDVLEVEIDLDGVNTAAMIFSRVAGLYPELQEKKPIIRVAVNEKYASWDTPVDVGDEIAFFPPVSGGSR